MLPLLPCHIYCNILSYLFQGALGFAREDSFCHVTPIAMSYLLNDTVIFISGSTGARGAPGAGSVGQYGSEDVYRRESCGV